MKIRLKDEERNFFRLVLLAGKANPFSDTRISLDSAIAGIYARTTEKTVSLRKFSEANHHSLAREYSLSLDSIYKIIAKVRAKCKEDLNQMNL